ncbi:MAG: hypothetical protein S4CHLAM45_03770 [Chlamydiales bacterium]|nr:hypothetical protein [Chlamydiales bacterium]MCH9619231.1 hypothetical protein [Chlamydiales bacterium]MCH9622493.1 hypothetical protein [Chlamydiales bacterium]
MSNLKAQNPLILRAHRLMDAFAKSDDERDFYLDRVEGFILFVDLDKDEDDQKQLQKELEGNRDRYCLIPKLTFYEVKKIMEGFVNEKVYDIDTKEKLLDIIGAKDAREHFLEFIYDHETELEKWHQYYQERSRVRIIEWLRQNTFEFVFEEDLDLLPPLLEKLKTNLFEAKVPKDVQAARAILATKAKTYYSNEALNPRPKRGRPPKQSIKVEVETSFSSDIFTQVPKSVRRFLYLPLIASASDITFSEKYDTEADFLNHLRGSGRSETENQLEALSEKFASLKNLSTKLGLTSDLKFPSFDEADEDEENVFLPKKKSRKQKKTVNVQPMTPRRKGKQEKE